MNRKNERDRAWALLTEAAQLHQDGKPELAEPLYREVLKSAPAHAQTWHLLGVARRQQGDSAEAASLIVRAIGLDPRQAEFHHNHGNALVDLGQLDKAEAAFRRALAINPKLSASLAALAGVLLRKQDFVQAVAFADLAIRNDQKDAEGWLIGGKAALELKQFDSAAAMLLNAVQLAPRNADAADAYGRALYSLGRRDDAERSFQRATEIDPAHVNAWIHLGLCRRRSPEAVDLYETALALEPDNVRAHANLGQTLLLQGNYRRGFAEYEWRRRDPAAPTRSFDAPIWDGAPLAAGQTLLVCCEQGLGDSLMFAGYLARIRQRLGAGCLALECPAPLRRLFAQSFDLDALVVAGDEPPVCDAYLPLMSAPYVFGDTLATIPTEVPYLRADADGLAAWAPRLTAPAGARKIGLVWAGNPRHEADAQRSTSLAALAPLFAAPDVAFFALQRGVAAEQAETPPVGAPLTSLGMKLTDFADLAAVIAQLDLVISVDTAPAHLAAAMDKPSWVLLPSEPDWRWLLGGEDWPWRRSVRLFRQARGEADFSAAIDRIAAALAG